VDNTLLLSHLLYSKNLALYLLRKLQTQTFGSIAYITSCIEATSATIYLSTVASALSPQIVLQLKANYEKTKFCRPPLLRYP